MTRTWLSSFSFLWLLLVAQIVQAQSFKHKASVDTVSASGFYAIEITPAMSSLVQTDFRDFRIRDGNGNTVPYLIGDNFQILDSVMFSQMKIVSNILNDSGQTVLIVENLKGEKVNAIYLRIHNAAVSRLINMSGSQDGKKWYSIVENVDLPVRFVQDRDHFIENISFPLSSYKYIRVIILNGKNDPLDILSVYKRNDNRPPEHRKTVDNPKLSYHRLDSNKTTYLTVENTLRFHIGSIGMKVVRPRFFKRRVDVITGGLIIGNFIISSDSLFTLTLPSFNDSVFSLRIYNEDNAPLEISGIMTSQNQEKIITYLEAGKHYELEMTNREASPPRYDLVNFKDSIPKHLPVIGISNIVTDTPVDPVVNSVFKQYWLWPTLIICLMVLGLFTYRLTKDISKPD